MEGCAELLMIHAPTPFRRLKDVKSRLHRIPVGTLDNHHDQHLPSIKVSRKVLFGATGFKFPKSYNGAVNAPGFARFFDIIASSQDEHFASGSQEPAEESLEWFRTT